MILDITRHKFYEGLLTLLGTTIIMITLLAVSAGESGIAPAPYSGLMSFIGSLTGGIGFIEGVFIVFIYFVSVLSLSRAALRSHIYPTDTMAPMALSAVLLLPMIVTEDALRQAVVVLLMSYSLANMFYCFGPHRRVNRLFTAMAVSGTLAVVEASLVVVPIVMSLALIVARKKFREALVVVVGLLLPMFAYCYIEWLLGDSFAHTLSLWWSSLTTNFNIDILDNITLTRLVFMAFVIFLQAVSLVLNVSQRDVRSSGARGVWRTLQLLFVVALCAALLLPSASASLLTVIVATAVAMLSVYFIHCNIMISVVTYTALLSLAVAASL
ncbi:MAG: hypothetical protein J6V26_03320 [Alistipes sp.]|nr:hypothetical protein [Alistipes sp.]